MSSILMIKDPATNQWLEVTSLVGPQGPKGNDGINGKDGENYILTAADKAEIAALVLDEMPVAEDGEY